VVKKIFVDKWRYDIYEHAIIIHSPDDKTYGISIDNLWFAVYKSYPEKDVAEEKLVATINKYVEKLC